MKVAIQGILGSFHHQAANQILAGENLEIVCCSNFGEVFRAVKNNQADYGLVAIENSLHGSINAVYRLLDKHNVWIFKDLRIHIAQNLIGLGGVSLEDLDEGENCTVLSHPVALAQVDDWLSENLPMARRVEEQDTAESVRKVVESQDKNLLGVAGTFAAETYGASVLKDNIQDDPNNYTRFILFSNEKTSDENPTHSSIILTTNHEPGALLGALQIFSKYQCNLTKLDSHPLPSDKQHYAFYVDYELNSTNGDLIDELKAGGYRIKVLGEYRRVE